jgi:hypothetical protein
MVSAQCSALWKMCYFAELQASQYKTDRDWVNVLNRFKLLSRSTRTNAVPRVLYKDVKVAVLRVVRETYIMGRQLIIQLIQGKLR